MAPEIIGGGPATCAADLYGAGVVLYEMLTGTTPFVGATTEEVFSGHLHAAVVAPSQRCPDRHMPVALERVILRMLSKDPRDRPRDAEMVAIEIARVTPALADAIAIELPAFSTNAPTRDWSPRRHVAC
jgi:serine/threonine protein kinase